MSVLCEAFLNRYEQDRVQKLQLPGPLASAYETIRQVCSSLLSLYTPVPNYCGSSVDDAVTLFKYTGTNASLVSMKVLLTEVPEWQEAMQEVLQFGAATVQLGPEVQQLTEEAYQSIDKADVDEVFMTCVQRLPVLSKSLRDGAMNDLESVLSTRVKCIAAKMMKTEDADVKDLIPSHVTAVAALLTALADAGWESIADVSLNFQRWQESNGQQLVHQTAEPVHAGDRRLGGPGGWRRQAARDQLGSADRPGEEGGYCRLAADLGIAWRAASHFRDLSAEGGLCESRVPMCSQ